MDREVVSLESVISQVAEALGYSSTIAPSFSAPPQAGRLPIVRMYNSTVIDNVGYDRCRVTTEVELQIIENATSCSEGEKNEKVCNIKCDAMEILNGFKSYTNIVDITEVNMYADTDFMSGSDHVAVRVKATVVSNYSRYSEQPQIM